jgi:hypothetical protein
MASVQKFSSQVIDYAERLSQMADAAEGRNHHSGGSVARWVLLPATGAVIYAVMRSDVFSRRAKEVVDDAKTRASELPDELMARVRQTNQRSSTQNGSRPSASARPRTSGRKTSSGRTRRSARKTSSASR